MSSVVELTTGLQGSGKTLHTLVRVKEKAEREERCVYYSGIKGVTLDGWVDLDAGVELPDGTTAKGGADWYKLPAGAIVVIDECQRIFRTRGTGAVVPKCVEAFETLRHQAHQVFLITQHPMLIDGNVRRLIGRHWHVMRNFGFKKATVHEFASGVRDNPDKNRKDSIRHEWFYPKKAFAWYHSAEAHTIKVAIPRKVFILPVAVLVGVLAAWWGVSRLLNMTSAVSKEHSKSASGVVSGTVDANPIAARRAAARDYFDERQPRVVGLPFTAPVYDEVVRPVRAPYPAACVASKSRCRCYSQQGTHLDVPEGMCREISANGFFVDFAFERAEADRGSVATRSDRPSETPERSDRPVGLIKAPERMVLSDPPPKAPDMGLSRPGGIVTVPKS